ncbi:two-component sensor histidine kinase [Nesterenkonia sp. MY13]|uniref:histidine kinase n=1 Tax=Nesterenkonia sedimenti TaxID=1463632 RepID=A0A7X8TKQ3_9MICC|nr:histidine kinase [Nesterenkonia sedimenti]NLS10581.1 two-component sensor histidine kinase [Nesterenkonia sedimenti]
MEQHQAPPAGKQKGIGQRRFAEQYAGVAILVLCLGLGAVLFFAGTETLIPGPVWLTLLVVSVGGLLIAGDSSRPRPWALAAYWTSVASSWVLIASLPPQNFGMMVVLLVVIAAVGSYVVPLWAAWVVVALNMAVVLSIFLVHGAPLADTSVWVVFYTIIHIAGVLSTYALYRESLLRAELEEKNLELEAAGVLLENSAATAERLRISRELHDAVGHQLTVLNLELEAAKHRVKGDQAEPHVERAAAVAKGLLADVRTTVGELRESDPGDIQASLERLGAAVPSLEIHIEVDPEVTVDEQQAAALVRAAQEIITNAVKHSEAQEVSLTLNRQEEAAVLTGTNDGLAPKSITLGHGLTGLRERVELLGGELKVTSHPIFTVEVKLPVGERA